MGKPQGRRGETARPSSRVKVNPKPAQAIADIVHNNIRPYQLYHRKARLPYYSFRMIPHCSYHDTQLTPTSPSPTKSSPASKPSSNKQTPLQAMRSTAKHTAR